MGYIQKVVFFIKKGLLITLGLSLFQLNAIANDDLQQLQKLRESFVRTTIENYSPSDEVTANYLKYSGYGRSAIDVLLLQLYLSVQLPEQEVQRVIDLFQEDRRWSDIDYTNMSRGGWDVTLHTTRIYALAKSYVWEGTKEYKNPWYKNPQLSRVIHNAANWWFDNMPINPNWWHNDIGVPKKIATAMLLIRDELTEKELQGTLKVLERSKFGRTGQNKVWLAGNQLMKAMLIDNVELAKEAIKQISEEVYVTESEGIQNDGSFHQHGPQLQFGNYGMCFAEAVSFWIRVCNGTDYAFSEKQIQIMENLIMDGIAWTIWNGQMDPSACGRQLNIDGGRGKAYSFAVAALNMASLGREKSEIFKQIALQNLQPQLYSNEFVGAKYFPRSDFGVYRAKDWYMSIRMHSERTIGYEFTNNENQLAHFSADGATLLMQSGDEYENIYPYWDWRKLPGVTSYEDGKPIKCSDKTADKKNNTGHVAGYAKDDLMATTMEINRDGLHALKSNFFFSDLVVCLGTDIYSDTKEINRITTAVEQNHYNGSYSRDGKCCSIKEKKCCKKGEKNDYLEVSWVNHNEKSYISLDSQKMKLEIAEQSGNWDKMAPIYQGKKASGIVFKLYFEHNPQGNSSYQYAVLPQSSKRDVKRFVKSSALKLLSNDKVCQAVLYKGKIMAVLHKAGEYELAGHKISVDSPAICVIVDGVPSIRKF